MVLQTAGPRKCAGRPKGRYENGRGIFIHSDDGELRSRFGGKFVAPPLTPAGKKLPHNYKKLVGGECHHGVVAGFCLMSAVFGSSDLRHDDDDHIRPCP